MAKKVNKDLNDTLKEMDVKVSKSQKVTKTTKAIKKTTKESENKIVVKFKKLISNAVIPTYAHDGDEGLDVYCTSVEYDEQKDLYIFHTGIACETDKNVAAKLHLRSGNCETDMYLTNHVGIVDSAIYRGELQFRMKNRDSIVLQAYVWTNRQFHRLPWYKKLFFGAEKWDEIYYQSLDDLRRTAISSCPYQPGDRIGQMVFEEFKTVKSIEVENLSETVRGEKGFGSTGK